MHDDRLIQTLNLQYIYPAFICDAVHLSDLYPRSRIYSIDRPATRWHFAVVRRQIELAPRHLYVVEVN
jgi:hypothetical protein